MKKLLETTISLIALFLIARQVYRDQGFILLGA